MGVVISLEVALGCTTSRNTMIKILWHAVWAKPEGNRKKKRVRQTEEGEENEAGEARPTEW